MTEKSKPKALTREERRYVQNRIKDIVAAKLKDARPTFTVTRVIPRQTRRDFDYKGFEEFSRNLRAEAQAIMDDLVLNPDATLDKLDAFIEKRHTPARRTRARKAERKK